jgi:hypothetical protein
MILFLVNYGLCAIEVYTFPYTIVTNDTFSSILKKFINENSSINARTPLVVMIRKNNPQINDWVNLHSGVEIQLSITSDFIKQETVSFLKSQQIEKIRLEAEALERVKMQEDEKKTENKQILSKTKASFFYMYSLGFRTQNQQPIGDIKYSQNSPFSLGGELNYKPFNKNYLISSSAFYTYLKSSENSLSSDIITLPPEFGANLYYEQLLKSFSFLPYVGIDFEQLSIFNFYGILTDRRIYINSISLSYLTFGISKSFLLFNENFNTKFSIAKSIISNYTKNDSIKVSLTNVPNSLENYSGIRFLFSLDTKLNDKFYIHSLVKYHILSGPSTVKSLQIGIGIGYVLF